MTTPATGRLRVVRACLCLVLALTLAACTDEDTGTPGSAPVEADETATLTTAPLSTKVSMGRVYGRLPQARRRVLQRRVGAIVDGWWDAAYLSGDFPRSRFPAAFPGFTKGAERRARRDKRLMSNIDIGHRIESVTPVRRQVVLDAVSIDRRARSVTARFVLRFRATGDKPQVISVRGRLFLTWRKGQWRVFGYDVAKGARTVQA